MTNSKKSPVCSKALAIFSLTAMLLGSILSGCGKSVPKTVHTPTPTKEVIDYNEDKDSNLGHWTRAMGSVLIYLNDGDPYYFGGYKLTKENKEAAAKILETSWNIHNQKELLLQIQTLLTTGDRKDYKKEAKEMRSLSKKKLKTAMKQLSGDLKIHYETVQYNWKKWKKKGLLAWDMCRISHLIQWGYVAGYLEKDQAQALIEPAAQKLKDNFTTWEQVQNNWLDGYCLIACVDRSANGNEYTNRKTIYEQIVKEQTKTKSLYDDRMFTAKLKPVQGISYKTLLEEVKPTKVPKKSKKTK